MYHLLNQDYRELIRALLYEEFGGRVGEMISYSVNARIMEKILTTIARKKTGKTFSERLEIRKELEDLVDQLVEDEEISGVNTYEWVLELLLDCEAVKVDLEHKRGIIIPLQK